MSIEEYFERIATALEKIAAGNTTPAAIPAPPVEKPAKTRAAKAAPVVEALPAEEATAGFLDDEPPAETKTYTKDEVRQAVIAYQKRHTPTKAQQLLKSFGAETLGALDPAKYAAVVDAASK